MQLVNNSRISAMSIVHPALVVAGFPSGAIKLFSVDSDGQVVSCHSPSLISHARQNSAAPFIRGQAFVPQEFVVAREQIMVIQVST